MSDSTLILSNTETSSGSSFSVSSADETIEETDYEAEIEDQDDDFEASQSQTENEGIHDADDVWDDELEPYQDEPLADEQWIADYQRRRQVKKETDEQMLCRLTREEPEDTWCKCGNCRVERLSNSKECFCCMEIEGCRQALHNETVIDEVGVAPDCVTLHPGFRPVCLEPWVLRLSADKFKTKQNKRYHMKEGENIFLRAVAYRDFTRLVHGKIGKKRIPLPACAYDAIRKKFPSDALVGYQEDSDN